MIVNESLDAIMKRGEIIVCDWDNVIQFIDKAWLVGVYQQKEVFEKYFDISKIENHGTSSFITSVLGRKEYYLDKWLQREEVTVPKEITDEFLKIYLEDPLFYEKCNYLIMAESLLNLSTQKFCEKIIFLSHSITDDGTDWRKERKFNEVFKDKKFQLNIIPHDMPKHEWIKEYCPFYTTFIDDRFDIIKDVVLHTESDKKTYIVPYLGYNEDYINNDTEFLMMCEDKGIVLSCYKQQFLSSLV